MSVSPSGRVAARGRHPSTRPPVPAPLLEERMAAELAGGGAPWPEVAAAVLADRGTTGRSPGEYAASLGVDQRTLERAEAGDLAPTELPGPLVRVIAARR